MRLADRAHAAAFRAADRVAGGGWRIVFNFHDVSPPDAPQHSQHHSTTPGAFVAQIGWIAEHFELVSLRELLGDRRTRRRRAAITFDDGFSSVMDHAEPVLRAAGAPFTLFLTVTALESGRLPVAQLLARDPLPAIVHAAYALLAPPVSEAEFAAEPLVWVEDFALLDPLVEAAGAARGSRTMFLDPRQVRELVARGADVGSHGWTHRVLASCDDRQLRQEIGAARSRLQELSGTPVDGLAIPFGKRQHYDERALAEARRAGHSWVLSSEPRAWHRRRMPTVPPRLSLLDETPSEARHLTSLAMARSLTRPPAARQDTVLTSLVER